MIVHFICRKAWKGKHRVYSSELALVPWAFCCMEITRALYAMCVNTINIQCHYAALLTPALLWMLLLPSWMLCTMCPGMCMWCILCDVTWRLFSVEECLVLCVFLVERIKLAMRRMRYKWINYQCDNWNCWYVCIILTGVFTVTVQGWKLCLQLFS